MHSLQRSIVSGLIICLSIVPTVQAGQVLGIDSGFNEPIELDFSSVPALSEIQVDGRTLRIERVENGFVISEASTPRTVVISDRELEAYRVRAVEERAGANSVFKVPRAELFGEKEALTVEVFNSDQGSFTGHVETAGVRHPVTFTSLEVDSNPSTANQLRVTDQITLIVQITITAAVVGIITCAPLSLLMNCASECTQACTVCGGSVKSYTKGTCGSCHCECQISGFTAEIPPGGSCTAY